jgi:hypothetical protein
MNRLVYLDDILFLERKNSVQKKKSLFSDSIQGILANLHP